MANQLFAFYLYLMHFWQYTQTLKDLQACTELPQNLVFADLYW